MITNIFSPQGESFLENEMCICMNDLTDKIFDDALEHRDFFKNMIDKYLAIDFHNSDDKPLTPRQSRENDKMFESALKYDENIDNLEDHPKARDIFEAIYFLLRSYTKEGLCGVWYHQDTLLSWYPKVIITKNFGSRDVVNNLDDIVTIYRGTGKDEFNSNKFGQAWSLNKDVAHRFAFSFYNKKPEYIGTMRVVIEARISKNDIFHYRRNILIEDEVVINPAKLIEGSICLVKEELLKASVK